MLSLCKKFLFFIILCISYNWAVEANYISILDFGATPNDYSDDDAIAINHAIESARDGDIIIIPEGKFHTRQKIVLKSNITLKWETTQWSEIAGIYYGEQHSLIIWYSVSNVTLTNLRLKSNSTKGIGRLIDIRHSKKITLSNLKLSRFIRHGVYINNTSESHIYNSTFEGAIETQKGGYGYGVVYTNGSSYGIVEKSNFIGPDIRHGVVIQWDKKTNNPSHHIVVYQNYFKNNTQDAIDLHGSGEYSNVIINNTIYGDPESNVIGRGIGLGENAHGASGEWNMIIGNTLKDTRYGVHVLSGSKNFIIHDNNIKNCKRHGIYIEDGSEWLISHNTITGCQQWWIYIKKWLVKIIANNIQNNIRWPLYID